MVAKIPRRATTFQLEFADRAAIAAIDSPTDNPHIALMEDGREGDFFWKPGNYASRVAADTYQGLYVAHGTVPATTGCYVRRWGGHRPLVTWWGAVGTDTGNQAPIINSALALTGSLFVPNGTWRTTAAVELLDYSYLQFESNNAILKGAHSGSAIVGKNPSTERRFFCAIESGRVMGGGSLSIGIDFANMSYGKIRDTFITAAGLGWRNGELGQGAFYNEATGLTVTSCGVGVRNGTLGNEIKMFGGSIKDMVVGSDDDNNSLVLYDGVAFETFTSFGGRISNSGAAADKITHRSCRFENPSTSGAYASAIAIRWAAASQNCRARDNSIISVSTGVSDGGTNNQSSGN